MNIGDHVFAYFEGNRALPRITGYGIVTELRGDGLVAVELDEDAMPPAARGRTCLFNRSKVTLVHTPAEITFDDTVVAVHDPKDDSIHVSARVQHGTVTISTAEIERLTREAYEAGIRATMAAMGVVQVSNTDDGLQAYGHNMTPAEARELARKITEAADALDPFPNDEKISTDSDPPKCPDCKGRGRVMLHSTDDECPRCLGSGY